MEKYSEFSLAVVAVLKQAHFLISQFFVPWSQNLKIPFDPGQGFHP